MMNQLVEKKILDLRAVINHHNYCYYVLDKPEISDFEFDALMSSLTDLEKQYPQFFDALSPTNRVGGGLIDGFVNVKHQFPMLSLSNTYSEQDIIEFDNRVKKTLGVNKVEYSCELKYDGVAISIIYKNGRLLRAVTRGDGISGDDVTKNIKTIKSIPLKLFGNYPNELEMRGEVFIGKSKFNQINNQRQEQKNLYLQQVDKLKSFDKLDNDQIKLKKKLESKIRNLDNYANPRNFASGTLKLLDSTKVADRGLDCILYNVYSDNLPHDNHIDNLFASKNWGFKIPKDCAKVSMVDDLMRYIKKFEINRDALPFEIDGIVIKINNLLQQNILGTTSKFPRWAVSYKFKSIQAITKLKDVVYQVGRTGSITPVACLEPVSLAGSIIKRASLHNIDFINKLDLKLGDTVIIEKGGDVIPKVTSVVFSKRNLLCKNIIFSKFCPSCHSPLVQPDDEINHYCFNSINCLPQKAGKIEHFVGRDAMNISSLGSKTILLLLSEGLIDSISDLYELKVEDFYHLKGFGFESNSNKKAQNIIDGIQQSKKNSFEKLLYAIGIRYVGKTVSKKIVKYFKNIDNLILASYEDLIKVDEIGHKIASSIVSFFIDNNNILLINNLKKHNLIFTEINTNISNKLNGINFLISGTFDCSRDELKNLIEINGGNILSSLSTKVNYLVAGENMGAKKKEKALLLKTTIISFSDLNLMLK